MRDLIEVKVSCHHWITMQNKTLNQCKKFQPHLFVLITQTLM
jgi:hypothetical protein